MIAVLLMIVYLPQPVATAKAEDASARVVLESVDKIHYNVKDFSRRRGINTMTANEASAARK